MQRGEILKTQYNATFLVSFIVLLLLFQGCSLVKKEIVYPYPSSKNVMVNSTQFSAIQNGMSEGQVFLLTKGYCTLISETSIQSMQFNTKSYGCNGKGSVGSTVILIFSGGVLTSKTQFGLN